jgi:hypothetical protein
LWPGAPGEPDKIDIETLLSDAFPPESPLVGLGEPGEAIGVGRITTPDAEWQRDVQKLAHAAQSILVIPSNHAGTQWELNYLKEQNLLSKSIFVMPPDSSDEIVSNWNRSSTQVPIWMPPYSGKGMLYTVNPDGKLQTSELLDVRTTAALIARIKKISNSSQDMVSFKLSDQPAIRFGGWMLICVVIVPIAALIMLMLFLALF